MTLTDHVTTVKAYLNDYRKTDNASERSQMSSLFSEYITAACWPMMYYRMTHWATLGLIKDLAQVSNSTINWAARGRNAPQMFDCKHDPRLASHLVGLAERHEGSSTLLQTVMAYHPDRTAVKDQLPALLSIQMSR